MSENITDPDDEFYNGCDDDCANECTADHQGES